MTPPKEPDLKISIIPRGARLPTVGLALVLAAGCTGGAPAGTDGANALRTPTVNSVEGGERPVLHVLAGSELADVEPVLAGVEERTGVDVELDFTGTLDGTQLVAEGGAAGRYDATWFPSNR